MSRRFKEILAAGELARVFCVGRLPTTVTVDLFALAGGFAGFWIDQEHVGLTWQEVQTLSVAARANGLDCFVRMAPTDYAAVTQNLEAGAGGVMAAQIQSAAHAEQFVQWAKFAPRGLRGLNTQGRDANYTHKPPIQFAADANRENFVAIQIETLGSLDEVEQIAALADVDLLFVGPSDLSQALGVLGQFDHPKLWEGIERIARACKAHGKHWGTVPADPKFADRCYELGCRMVSIAPDVRALRLGIDAAKTAYGSLFQK
ncbi:MAG: host specificity protein [Planctomycetes bacterium]|nr:host specificity protein [Planctomycetota bacterium]